MMLTLPISALYIRDLAIIRRPSRNLLPLDFSVSSASFHSFFFLHNSLLACSSVCPRPIWRFRSGRDVILHQVFLARNHLLFDGVFKIARVFFITADNLFVCAEPIVATHRRRTFGTHCGTQNKEKHRRKKKASSECSSKNKTRANLPGFPLNVNNYSPRWNVCLFVFSTGKNVIVY